jgi:dienelactone hydrolase
MQSKRLIIFILCLLVSIKQFAQITLTTPNVEAVLYLGEGRKQPLIVGLGGSEGGNAWTSDYWKKTRDQFISKGYAFLAIGYFRAKGAPAVLEKIAIEDVYNAIRLAAGQKGVNGKRIAIIGGSRGADLALLLGSYYPDINCVVSIVGSNAVFPSNTIHFSSSCWTYQQAQLPFLPVNDAAVPFLMKRNLRGAFEEMLKDSTALAKAVIPVEKIRGPILFLSATKDEVCPSTPMAEAMMERLSQSKFKYPYLHKAVEGGHAAPLKHFDEVIRFLDMYFLR